MKERGFFNGLIELPKDRAHWSITLLFIAFAYLLSFWVRLEWIDFAQANYVDESGEVQYLRPDMIRNGVAYQIRTTVSILEVFCKKDILVCIRIII